MLEENSFRGRSADFLMMFIFGSLCMIVCAFFVNLLFLGKIINVTPLPVFPVPFSSKYTNQKKRLLIYLPCETQKKSFVFN